MMTSAYQPQVLVVLLNYRGFDDTIECLESLLKNSWTRYSVIICDNDSRDGSVERLHAWKEHRLLPTAISPRIDILSTGVNGGFAAGNNFGIRHALDSAIPFDYVWLLNTDTVIEPDSLELMVALAVRDPKIGVVGSKLLYYHDRSIIQSIGNNGVCWHGTGLWSLWNEPDRDVPDSRVDAVLGASMLVSRKAIDAVGLMDESYFMQHEETDWCLRISRAGFLVYTCGASVVYHKEGRSSKRKSEERKALGRRSARLNTRSFLISSYYTLRNEILFIKKNYPLFFPLYVVSFLPYALTKRIVGYFLFRDDRPLLRTAMILRAACDGLRGKKGMTVKPEDWQAKIA